MPSKYYQVTDGEWIRVRKRGLKDQCCDCGLVHRMNFRINERGQVEVQATVDRRATAAARKSFGFTKED